MMVSERIRSLSGHLSSFLRTGSSEILHNPRAKEEAEKNLAEALAAKSELEREFASYRASADERAHRLAAKVSDLTSDRAAARREAEAYAAELHQARLGQGAAFTAFLERILCSASFPTVASDLAGNLSLHAVDGVLDEVVKEFPTLEKGKYTEPPLGDDEVTRAIASVAVEWMRVSPVLKSVLTSPTLLSEEQIRQLCPEDRDEEMVRFMAEVRQSATVPPEEEPRREDGQGDEGRTDTLNSEIPPHAEAPSTGGTGAEGTPSSGSAPEQNVV